MTERISDVKSFVRRDLDARCEPVPPKTQTSQQKHLSVWSKPMSTRAIGVEFGHEGHVNLWLPSMYAPATLPETVKVVRKVWNKTKWVDKDPILERKGRDGANSNLAAYDALKGKPLTRLGVHSIEDAKFVLDHFLE